MSAIPLNPKFVNRCIDKMSALSRRGGVFPDVRDCVSETLVISDQPDGSKAMWVAGTPEARRELRKMLACFTPDFWHEDDMRVLIKFFNDNCLEWS